MDLYVSQTNASLRFFCLQESVGGVQVAWKVWTKWWCWPPVVLYFIHFNPPLLALVYFWTGGGRGEGLIYWPQRTVKRIESHKICTGIFPIDRRLCHWSVTGTIHCFWKCLGYHFWFCNSSSKYNGTVTPSELHCFIILQCFVVKWLQSCRNIDSDVTHGGWSWAESSGGKQIQFRWMQAIKRALWRADSIETITVLPILGQVILRLLSLSLNKMLTLVRSKP